MTETQDSSAKPDGDRVHASARISVVVITAFAVVACIAVLIGLFATGRRAQTPSSTVAVTSAAPAHAVATEAEPDLPRAAESKSPAPNAQPAAPSVVPDAAPLLPEPSSYARELVASLYQLDLSEGRLSPEQAAQWQTNLAQLIRQGPTGVAAIREFLEKNVDYDFLSISGEKLFGYATMRTALFDALRQIGGPEALAVTLQTLQGTAEPREIALLAGSLEQQAPAQYRESVLNAARRALSSSKAAETESMDVAPLFEVFQRYGGDSAVADLQSAAARWDYYARIALAQLPDGAGVPALIEMATKPAGAKGGDRNFTFELLAQVARESPEARSALLEQARQNQIPDEAWPGMASALAGRDTGFLKAVLGDKPPGRVQGSKWYHVASGNQHFYSTPRPGAWSEGHVNERVALIDQFLAGNPNNAAVKALGDARAALLSGRP